MNDKSYRLSTNSSFRYEKWKDDKQRNEKESVLVAVAASQRRIQSKNSFKRIKKSKKFRSFLCERTLVGARSRAFAYRFQQSRQAISEVQTKRR